jgi:hypothetical protein
MTTERPAPRRPHRLRFALVTTLAALLVVVPAAFAGNATGINIQVPAGYSIAGSIKTTAAVAITGATVIATGTAGSGVATTSSTGAYAVKGLAAGTYKLMIYAPTTANLVDGWYTTANANHHTVAAASASGIVVGPSKTGINVAMPAGYTIAGKLTNTAGVALAGASVSASGVSFDTAVTDGAGNYKLKGLAAGSYTLLLAGPAGSNYLHGVYTTANANRFTVATASATKVAVGPSKTGINAKIPTGYSISGIVTSPSGTPLANVAVAASAAGYAASATTDATGKYTVKGLAAGTYKLAYAPGNVAVVEGFYTTANANHFTTVAASASGVVVGPTKTGVNVKLAAGYSISGKLTNTSGAALAYATVTTGAGPSARTATTDGAGNYKLVGLKAGSYTLTVTPPYGMNLQTGHYTTVNANRFTALIASATKLTVGPSLTAINIKVPAGYSIAGKITGPGGVALAYAVVSASNANGSFVAFTGADGTYKVIGLSAGSYKVNVLPPYGQALVAGWYTTANAAHFTPSAGSATAVVVGP